MLSFLQRGREAKSRHEHMLHRLFILTTLPNRCPHDACTSTNFTP